MAQEIPEVQAELQQGLLPTRQGMVPVWELGIYCRMGTDLGKMGLGGCSSKAAAFGKGVLWSG